MATYLSIRERTAYLTGNTDFTTGTANTALDSHINSSVTDILNMYPFSWNLTPATLTLSAGTANLPSDYNPRYHLYDVRIASNAGALQDTIFEEIGLEDRNTMFNPSVYWITYNTSTNLYVLNTPTQTGSLTIYYYFIPADMSGDSDVCTIPDGEAVAYLAAAKNYIGDERNVNLKTDYEQEAMRRVQTLNAQDAMFGPMYNTKSAVDYNDLTTSSK